MNRRRDALRGPVAFSKVFASGRRLEGTLVRCFAVLTPSAEPRLEVGFAVSSRAYNAVRRNRLRRLMRAAFAVQRDPLLDVIRQKSTSVSLVFSFKPRSAVDVRRLSIHPVADDVSSICRILRGFL